MPDSPQEPSTGARPTLASSLRDAAPSPPFRCWPFHRGVDVTWVKAFGDLDLSTVAVLDGYLRDALESARLVVLDLGDLTFIDVAGARAIADAGIRAAYNSRRLLVAFVPDHIERTLLLTGLADAIETLDLDETEADFRMRVVNDRPRDEH